MGRTIRLQPIQGKFLQTSVNGKNIDIFLVDPRKDNQQGTDVDYEDALRILAFKHPVAIPAQIKGKDGKFIQQLTDEDKAKIEQYKHEVPNLIGASSNSDTVTKLVETQSELLKAQGEMLATMKAEIEELKKKKK